MDKLKIGIYSSFKRQPEQGGGFSYVHTLLQAIDAYRFHPKLEFVVVNPGEGDYQLSNIPTIHLKKLDDKYQTVTEFAHHTSRHLGWAGRPLQKAIGNLERRKKAAYLLAVESQLRAEKIDLLYLPHPEGLPFNYPFVLTNWDLGHMSMFPFPEVCMNGTMEDRQWFYQNIVSKAFGVLCESEAGKKELQQYSGIAEERLFVVPMFPSNVVSQQVDGQLQQQHLQDLGLTDTAFFFYPAQFWSHKNHYNLLHAFAEVAARHAGIKLVLTGSDKGNLAYIKETAQRLSLQDQIIFAGFVSAPIIHSLYRHAAAMVMPTFLGPTNMPLLEAEALGCPVICSDLSGHREMLNDRGRYVHPEDYMAIAAAMEAVLDAPPPRVPHCNEVFNIANAMKKIEAAFLAIYSRRKAFGFNYQQY